MGYVAESLMALAELALDEGRAAESERLAREALTEFERESARPNAAQARALLARALLAQNRNDEAEEAVSRARALIETTEYRLIRSRVAIEWARIRAEAFQPGPAVRALEAVRKDAKACGCQVLDMEARLAQGEIELRLGDAGFARQHLADLAEEAARRGLELIARRARETAGAARPR